MNKNKKEKSSVTASEWWKHIRFFPKENKNTHAHTCTYAEFFYIKIFEFYLVYCENFNNYKNRPSIVC